MQPHAKERLTIDMLLERDGVGDVAIVPKTKTIILEYLVPLTDVRSLPYSDNVGAVAARKRLFVSRLPYSEGISPLFEQKADVSYSLAGATPLSPDGRYLGVIRLQGGKADLGFYDFRKGRVRFLNSPISGSPLELQFQWIDTKRVLFLGLESADDSTHLTVFDGPQRIALERERAWHSGGVSASIVGGGQYLDRTIQPAARKIQHYNLKTDELTTLGSGAYGPMLLSPDGKHLAIRSEVPDFDLKVNKVTGVGAGTKKTIEIVDLRRSEIVTSITQYDADMRALSWSSDGQRLLVLSTNNRLGTRAYFLYQRENSVFAPSFETGISDCTGLSVKDARWAGSQLLLFGSLTEENGAAWYMLDGDEGLIPVGGGWQDVSVELLETSETSFEVLHDGDVWRIGLDGGLRNLTTWTDAPLRLAARVGRADTLTEKPFLQTGADGGEVLMFLDTNGARKARFMLPARKTTLKAATANTIVYVSNIDRSRNVLLVQSPGETPQELFEFNKHLVDVASAAGPIRIDHTGKDGTDLVGWLYLPPGADLKNAEPYPLVAVPYAERVYKTTPPSTSYAADRWNAEIGAPTSVEVLAAAGYAVLLPSIPLEPRGTRSDQMLDLVRPVLSALDAALETGFVDSERLAISGHSHGGYSVNSLVTQTNRFNVAIATAGAANVTSQYGQFSPMHVYKSDRALPSYPRLIEDGFGRNGVPPWEDPGQYIRNSPLFHAQNIETPLMLIHGDLDFVHIGQAEEMFTALARQGKDVLFVRYWGEAHAVERPQNIHDMWARVFDFLKDNGVTPGPKTVH